MLKTIYLVEYSSSEESEEETENRKEKKSQSRLPLPDDIKQLFDSESHTDNPSEHGGRIRSFAHEAGNWATLVYAPYYTDDTFYHLQQQLFLCLRPLEFQPMEDYHLSLSRTVTIRHHWIQQMVDTLRREFSTIQQCTCSVIGPKIYTNDEKTRSFLALEVSTPGSTLEQYVKVVDSCFTEYSLQKYYQLPSFHISIGWCLGDVTSDVKKNRIQKLQDVFNTAVEEDPELLSFHVDELRMKTGNKQFNISLYSHGNG